MVPVFAVFAMITAVPLACYLRDVDRDPRPLASRTVRDDKGDDRDASVLSRVIAWV